VIPLFKVNMSPRAREMVGMTLDSGYVGQGQRTAEFEHAFAVTLGLDTKHPPLGVNSCSSAIDLALHLTTPRPNSGHRWNVVTTPITCSATNGSIVTRGGRIKWADVDPLTGNIDPISVAKQVDQDTAAVIAVDWGGRSCDYSTLRRAASGRPVIQDAAHRLYVDPHNRGDYVCWSFGPIKHLTCGGYGGALLPPVYTSVHPDNLRFSPYERAKKLRWHGLDRESKSDFRCEQDIVEVGYRYHMTDDMASVGLANLPMAIQGVTRNRANALWYTHAFANVPGITIPPYDHTCDYWLFTLLVEDRDGLKAYLEEHGIASSQVHARNDKHSGFRAGNQPVDLPSVEWFDKHQLSIPVGWWVDDVDRERIASAVIHFATERVAAVA
jgi:perosamine synthetase